MLTISQGRIVLSGEPADCPDEGSHLLGPDRCNGLCWLGQPQQEPAEEAQAPAVFVRASSKPDYLACLVCRKKQKTLKQHIQRHGITPAQYREVFALTSDYPMVAPEYSKRRGRHGWLLWVS